MNKKPYRIAAIILIAAGLVLCLRAFFFSAKTVSLNTDKLVLVIDPGHGGADGGAVGNSADGSGSYVHESVINLDISMKLDCIMGLFGVPVVMTRESEDITYPQNTGTIKQKKAADLKRRAELVNGIPNAILISIHQNKFTTSSPHGAQVFYAKGYESEQFALAAQAVLIEALDPTNHRAAKLIDDSIYLMKNVNCPAILVECGFMSNQAELLLLQNDNYQTKIATALAAAFLQFYPQHGSA